MALFILQIQVLSERGSVPSQSPSTGMKLSKYQQGECSIQKEKTAKTKLALLVPLVFLYYKCRWLNKGLISLSDATSLLLTDFSFSFFFFFNEEPLDILD